MTARGLYRDPISFQPQCKIILATNNKPSFNGNDTACTDRVKLIPFNARFVDSPIKSNERQCILNIDKILIDSHLDEFFSWLLEGSKNYFADEKLTPPESILEAETNYILEQASFKSWANESIVSLSKNKLNRSTAYTHYEKFCNENSLKAETKRKFYEQMANEYICYKSNGDMVYRDIDIKKAEAITETMFNDLDQ